MTVLGYQNYAARDVLPAMEQLCGDSDFVAQPLSTTRKILLAWDWGDQPDSKCAAVSQEFWLGMPKTRGPRHVPFTPDARGTILNMLALSVTAVWERLKTARLEAFDMLRKFPFLATASWKAR